MNCSRWFKFFLLTVFVAPFSGALNVVASDNVCGPLFVGANLEGYSPKYFSPRMKRLLSQRVQVVDDGAFGRGVKARQSIAKNAIVGYFSGPIYNGNNEKIFDVFANYVGSAQVEYPSGLIRYVHILPTGSTPFFNHAPSKDFLDDTKSRDYIANVEMGYAKLLKINGGLRPVIPLRATRPIASGEELFFDYGKTEQSIFFEALTRQSLAPSKELLDIVSRRLGLLVKKRFEAWAQRRGKSTNEISREEFMLELYINFLNSPPEHLLPNQDMAPI